MQRKKSLCFLQNLGGENSQIVMCTMPYALWGTCSKGDSTEWMHL